MSVKQISVFLENRAGRLAEVTRTLHAEGINIRAMSLADTADFGVLRIIVVEDQPGGLHKVLGVLDAAGINVEYMYAYVEKTRDNAIVICRVDERERALEALTKGGIPTLDRDALKGI
jgi:hypothetical protein